MRPRRMDWDENSSWDVLSRGLEDIWSRILRINVLKIAQRF